MRYSKSDIIDLAGKLLLEDKVKGNPDYEWIDIVGLKQRPRDLQTALFFATFLDGTDGWHKPVNRPDYLEEIITKYGWHVVVEPGAEVSGEHLVVSSLMELTDRLYFHAWASSKPYVIGVTGSVGKTTTVAFLEHMIKMAGFSVVRFFSERLTPLLVKTLYINQVFPETKFVVMEYAAFLPGHVNELAMLLPPNLAFLTNVYSQHIRDDLFDSREAILESKMKIRASITKGYINRAILDDMKRDTPEGWGVFDLDQEVVSLNSFLPPTRRTGELYAVGKIVAKKVGISDVSLQEAFSSFVPPEGRISTCKLKSGTLFFDAEAPHGPRLYSWFETLNGSVPSLFVDSITFGNDNVSTYMDLLNRIFSSQETYVLDTEQNRNNIPVNCQFVTTSKFIELLEKRISQGHYTVYHKTVKGQIPGFDPKTYLRDTWGLT